MMPNKERNRTTTSCYTVLCLLPRIPVDLTFSKPFTFLHLVLRTLFQVPYPVSPAFATLTKTAGGVGVFFPFWKNLRVRSAEDSYFIQALFTFLRTLLHTAKFNSFLFKRLRTLCPKTPGWGYLSAFKSPTSGILEGQK